MHKLGSLHAFRDLTKIIQGEDVVLVKCPKWLRLLSILRSVVVRSIFYCCSVVCGSPVFGLYFDMHYFSFQVLQSSWWARESWLPY